MEVALVGPAKTRQLPKAFQTPAWVMSFADVRAG